MSGTLGKRWVRQGSLADTVLSYAISEPGEWTASSIADDLGYDKPYDKRRVSQTVVDLCRRGWLAARNWNDPSAPLHPSPRALNWWGERKSGGAGGGAS